jgi:ABC-2 type transport system permease protein
VIIHSDKLRWLFWLRWKIFLRAFTRGSGRVVIIVGRFLLLLFGLGVGGTIAVLSFLAYRFLPSPANTEALFLVLTSIYVIWMVLPLLEFNINEGLDPSKLSLFPLTRAELMVSMLFSTVLDLPMIGVFLVLVALVAGWAASFPLALVALLGALIFYVQLIGISQLVLALLMRTLQSRRFRDVMTVVLIILLSSSGILWQFLARGLASSSFLAALQHSAFSSYLQWLPPGMVARAIQQAVAGHWGMSLLWLGGSFVVAILVLYLWQFVVERSLRTAESAGAVKSVRHRKSETVGRGAVDQPVEKLNLLVRILPRPVVAIMLKDFKYFRRDPQLQAMLVQSVVTIVLAGGYVAFSGIQSGEDAGSFLHTAGPWAMMIAPLFMVFSLFALTYNVLGSERQSLTMLFLFPVNPKYILWGKNLTVFIVGMVEMTVLVLVAAFLSRAWEFVLPALIIGLAAIVVLLACGNFTSVFFPQRMKAAFRGFQASANLSAEGGCLRGLMSMLAFYSMVIILVPVEASLVLPVIFHVQWWWLLSIPLSLVYAGAIYYIVTSRVAPRILNKAPEILAATTRE